MVLQVTDADGLPQSLKTEGAGTPGNPFVLLRRNFNVKSAATLSDGITILATSVTAIVANPDRRYLAISVTVNDVFIKLQAAGDDDDLKGETVPAGETWRMPVSAIYDGEVSAIKDGAGQDPIIYVTEY